MKFNSQNLWYVQTLVEMALADWSSSLIKSNGLPLNSQVAWVANGQQVSSRDLSEMIAASEKAEIERTQTVLPLDDYKAELANKVRQYSAVFL